MRPDVPKRRREEDRRRFGWVDRGGGEEGRAAVVGMFSWTTTAGPSRWVSAMEGRGRPRRSARFGAARGRTGDDSPGQGSTARRSAESRTGRRSSWKLHRSSGPCGAAPGRSVVSPGMGPEAASGSSARKLRRQQRPRLAPRAAPRTRRADRIAREPVIRVAPALPCPTSPPVPRTPYRLVRCSTGMLVLGSVRRDGPAVPVHPVLCWYCVLVHRADHPMRPG
jgi:hypothetical protein